MGIRRKIDFILVSSSVEIISGHGSTEVELGSDHRAVKSIVRLQTFARNRTRFPPSLKNRKPVIGTSEGAQKISKQRYWKPCRVLLVQVWSIWKKCYARLG